MQLCHACTSPVRLAVTVHQHSAVSGRHLSCQMHIAQDWHDPDTATSWTSCLSFSMSLHLMWLLDYVLIALAHLHTHKRTQKDFGGGQTVPCWAAPRPTIGATSPQKAHVLKPRGAEEHNGRQVKDSWGALPGPSQGYLRRTISPMSRCDTHHDESSAAALQIR